MRITENLLSITRIDGENASVKKTPELMEEVMEGAVSKFHRHYGGIPVQVHLPEEALLVPMDPLLMQHEVTGSSPAVSTKKFLIS